MSEKTCAGCKQSLPCTHFSRDKHCKDGLAAYCKPCKSQKAKQCNLDPEKARARRKKWAEANPEQNRAIQRADSKRRRREKHALDPQMREAAKRRAKACYKANKQRHLEYAKRWKARNPEKVIVSALSYHLKKQYKLTLQDYLAIVDQQHGLCAICGQPPGAKEKGRLHVDHCHKTGKVRGLLCYNCNNGLGALKDDPEIVAKALEYLKTHLS